jgi:hypothetical protein
MVTIVSEKRSFMIAMGARNCLKLRLSLASVVAVQYGA